MTEVGLEEESVEESPLDSALAGRMIKYLGIDNKLPASQQLDEINAFIEKMAEASGKSAGSVSQFVSELDEDKFESAMSVFEKKIQELKVKREEALTGEDRKMAKILRRKISRLKKKTRQAA